MMGPISVKKYFSRRDASAVAAERYAAVMMVDAYCFCGYTRCAAVAVVARRFDVSPSTVWRWRGWIKGIAPDLGDQIIELAPKALRLEIVESEWFAKRQAARDAKYAKDSRAFSARRAIKDHLDSLRARHPEEPADAR